MSPVVTISGGGIIGNYISSRLGKNNIKSAIVDFSLRSILITLFALSLSRQLYMFSRISDKSDLVVLFIYIRTKRRII